jgi:hypothetical protein
MARCNLVERQLQLLIRKLRNHEGKADSVKRGNSLYCLINVELEEAAEEERRSVTEAKRSNKSFVYLLSMREAMMCLKLIVLQIDPKKFGALSSYEQIR